MQLHRRDLLGIKDLAAEEITGILDAAQEFKKIFSCAQKKFMMLKGKTIVTLFYEPSTRTRTSFETAGKWLGADVINIAVATSSVQKGENLRDTAKTLQAMGVDMIVIRHSAAGVPQMLAGVIEAGIINAGDGANEHPTQALLDFFTIREKYKSFQNLKITIVGDILHSRVARSNIWGLLKLGATVTVVGPPTLIPPGLEHLGVRITNDLREGIQDADVINILRIQLERQKKGLFPSIGEYTEFYGINQQKLLEWAKPDVLVMHPGPANLGVEISEDTSSGRFSAITEQVTNGVAVRMALLYLLAGGRTEDVVIN